MNNTAAQLPRHSQRAPIKIPIRLAVKHEGVDTVQWVKTVNLSKYGMCVETPVALSSGQAAYVMVGKAVVPSGYWRVVWASDHEAGLEFIV